MKVVRCAILLVALLGLGSCGVAEKPHPSHDFAAAPVVGSPGYKPVPPNLIAKLPGRIARLPAKKSLRGMELLTALGLEGYAGNLSMSGRRISYVMQLDRECFLQIACESRAITRGDIDEIINNPATTPAGMRRLKASLNREKVIGCTLRKRDQVLADRWFEAFKSE